MKYKYDPQGVYLQWGDDSELERVLREMGFVRKDKMHFNQFIANKLAALVRFQESFDARDAAIKEGLSEEAWPVERTEEEWENQLAIFSRMLDGLTLFPPSNKDAATLAHEVIQEETEE